MAFLFKTLPLRSGEAVLIGPPLFHGFGLAFLAVALSLGSPVVLCRRFEAEDVAQSLVLHHVKTLVAVPVMSPANGWPASILEVASRAMPPPL